MCIVLAWNSLSHVRPLQHGQVLQEKLRAFQPDVEQRLADPVQLGF